MVKRKPYKSLYDAKLTLQRFLPGHKKAYVNFTIDGFIIISQIQWWILPAINHGTRYNVMLFSQKYFN